MILSITKKAVRKDRVLCVYHNEISQNKKTLLFIHNLGGSAINYQLQFRAFSNRYNIIAYDLLGHGQSAISKNAKDYALHEQMLDVKNTGLNTQSHSIVPGVTGVQCGEKYLWQQRQFFLLFVLE